MARCWHRRAILPPYQFLRAPMASPVCWRITVRAASAGVFPSVAMPSGKDVSASGVEDDRHLAVAPLDARPPAAPRLAGQAAERRNQPMSRRPLDPAAAFHRFERSVAMAVKYAVPSLTATAPNSSPRHPAAKHETWQQVGITHAIETRFAKEIAVNAEWCTTKRS